MKILGLVFIFVIVVIQGVSAQSDGFKKNNDVDKPSLAIIDSALVSIKEEEAFDNDVEFRALEFSGEVLSLEGSVLVVNLSNNQELGLIVDAETLIYINGKLSSVTDIKIGDDVFGYYVNEKGLLKSDWIEVIR